MATNFPDIPPNGRTYTPGAIPSTSFKGLAGTEVRVRHGTVASGHALSLTFQLIPEYETKRILDHFFEAHLFDTFFLPSTAFNGLTYPATLNPYNNVWRYKDPPKITYGNNGYHSVSVDFVSVPA
jgi:hypothetical protein